MMASRTGVKPWFCNVGRREVIQCFRLSFLVLRAALVDGNKGTLPRRSVCAFLLVAALAGSLLRASDAPPATASFYVAPNGKDSWSGKLAAPNASNDDGPFASPARAQSAVQSLMKSHPSRPVVVMLRGGTYYLPLSPTNPGTLNFTSRDSGSPQTPVVWENYPGEAPIISGGEAIGNGGLNLTWAHASGNLWTVQLPATTQPFEYLFYNGQRRLRARIQSSSPKSNGYYFKDGSCYSTTSPGPSGKVSPALCNLGTFLRIADEVSPETPQGSGCPSVTNRSGSDSKCLDRIAYDPSDSALTNWANLNPGGSRCGGSSNSYPVGDIELILFDAWTVDVMRISCVDTRSHVIYLTGATKGNGDVFPFFGPGRNHRYIIENVKDAFNTAKAAGQGGLWFLDRSTSPPTLNYLANNNENPNADTVVIAQTSPVSPIGGSLISATDLNNVTFQGITFEVDNFLPPAEGYNNDENSDDSLPEAIDCESCQSVIFDGVTVRHTSSSGILIASVSATSGTPGANDAIRNSAFYDIGDSGVRIGHKPSGMDRAESQVQRITVENNLIQGYSRVFADGEGIAQAGGHDLVYSHNDINDGYHAGISACLLGCGSIGYTANGTNILSSYNHIWNIMQGVTSDGGTLYYNVGSPNGSGLGNKIYNNLVHDTTDSSIIDSGIPGTGYGGAGIYLDIGSAGVDVQNNIVYRVASDAVYMPVGPKNGMPPNTFNNNIFAYARSSMFREGKPWPHGCAGASMRASLTNNIFYFDRDDSAGFYVVHGCAFSCGLPHNQFQKFEGNLYWRTDGNFASDPKAFHTNGKPPNDASKCFAPANPNMAWTFLNFSQWRDARPQGTSPTMGEDNSGTVTVNPNFGSSGQPSDFRLSKNPIPGFDFTKTNDTIDHAGRVHSTITIPPVPATFPTYSFTSF